MAEEEEVEESEVAETESEMLMAGVIGEPRAVRDGEEANHDPCRRSPL